jgi:hypothetical protein
VTRLRDGQPGFDSRQGQGFFLIATMSILLSNGCRGLFQPEAKRPGREADNSPPFSAEVKNKSSWLGTSLSTETNFPVLRMVVTIEIA